MPITSYFPETWDLLSRGTTPDGLPMCHVRHQKADVEGHTTVYRLVQRAKGWYNVGRLTTIPGKPGGFIPAPERLGKKLSGSRMDLTLLSFAETGHGSAYAA